MRVQVTVIGFQDLVKRHEAGEAAMVGSPMVNIVPIAVFCPVLGTFVFVRPERNR